MFRQYVLLFMLCIFDDCKGRPQLGSLFTGLSELITSLSFAINRFGQPNGYATYNGGYGGYGGYGQYGGYGGYGGYSGYGNYGSYGNVLSVGNAGTEGYGYGITPAIGVFGFGR